MKLLISSVLVVYLWAYVQAQSDISSEIPRIPSVPSLPEIPSLNSVLPDGATNPLSNINTNLNSLTNGLSNSIPNNPMNGLQGLSNTLPNNPLNSLQQGLSNTLPNSPLQGLENNVIPSNGQQSGGLFSGIINSITRPLVDIGPSRVSAQGSHIGVNVPFVYSLDLDTRGAPGQSRLTSNTMMGLVRVDRDRVRGPDGKLTGPVQVSIMGLPIYNNGQAAPAPGTSVAPNGLSNNVVPSGLTDQLPSPVIAESAISTGTN